MSDQTNRAVIARRGGNSFQAGYDAGYAKAKQDMANEQKSATISRTEKETSLDIRQKSVLNITDGESNVGEEDGLTFAIFELEMALKQQAPIGCGTLISKSLLTVSTIELAVVALRAQQDEPKLPSGTLRIGQRISGKIVALDAERGLASIKWETSVHAPKDERKRLTRFKGVKYRPGEILSANELLDGYIYWLVTNDQVAFKCPCGCGNLVLLDISPTMRSHKWKFQEVRAGYITLEPSIHSESTCGSHYYIRENQILWMN